MNEFENNKYERAKKQVKEIKGFYSHLTIYCIINIVLFMVNTGVFRGQWQSIGSLSWHYFTTPFFWGIGLLAHGLYVFQHRFSFFRNWEERKIKEFMEKDDEDFNKTSKWN